MASTHEKTEQAALYHFAKLATAQFGYSDVQFSLLAQGQNATLRVNLPQDGEVFALRIYGSGYQEYPSILSELKWLRILDAAGLSVPRPVANIDGDLIARISDDRESRYCVMFHWLYGDILAPENVPLQGMKHFGTCIARMHQVARVFADHTTFARPYWNWEGIFQQAPYAQYGVNAREDWQEALGLSISQQAILNQVSQHVKEAMHILGNTVDAMGFIHADLNAVNVLFSGDAISILDFEDCGWGYWTYDLAVPLFWYRRLSNYSLYRQALEEGYTRICPLPRYYETMLETFFAARIVFLLRWISGHPENASQTKRAQYFLPQAMQELESFVSGSYKCFVPVWTTYLEGP